MIGISGIDVNRLALCEKFEGSKGHQDAPKKRWCEVAGSMPLQEDDGPTGLSLMSQADSQPDCIDPAASHSFMSCLSLLP